MTVSTLLYFVWSIGSEVSEPLLPHYEGGARWFNHPLYSTWVYGSPRQTKTSRVTLVLMNFSAQLIGCALIHEVLDEESEGAKVGIGLAVGFGFGFIASQFFGCILVGLVNVHRLFLNEIKTCDTHDKREACFQVYENRRLSRNYLFYFLALAFYGGCMWGSIGLTINFDNTRFWYFMLSLAICVFGEFIILDFLRVALGKGDGCIARFIQSRGYYIDYKLDLDYESYLADNE